MAKIAMPLVVLFAACQPVAPGEVFQVQSGDGGFTDDEFAIMRAEADELCDATSGRYCPILTRDLAENVVKRVPEMSGPCVGLTEAWWNTDAAGVTIFVKEGLSREKLALTWRHELGHAGGCFEHLEPGNVMAPDIKQQSVDWTAADIACVDRRY